MQSNQEKNQWAKLKTRKDREFIPRTELLEVLEELISTYEDREWNNVNDAQYVRRNIIMDLNELKQRYGK